MSETLRIIPVRELPPLSVGLQDAARMVGVSPRTLRDLVKAGDVPVVQPGGPGGKLIFRIATLDKWLESREANAIRWEAVQ